MQVLAYGPERRDEWDRFVEGSKNGTFLFLRDYMEYHAERFEDRSLMVRDRKGTLQALLPANGSGATLVSHQGLTYGGLVLPPSISTARVLEIFDCVLGHLRRRGYREMLYKCVPHIYHRLPAEEDRYALFRHAAVLEARDLSTAVRPEGRGPVRKGRKHALGKARRAELEFYESDDLAGFWRVLHANLEAAHGVSPTHSLQEMRLLQGRFPERIRLFCVGRQGEIEGGGLIYDTGAVAHAQYLASSHEGRSAGALDLLIDRLIEGPYRDRRFFDFGISTERGGHRLNRGLLSFKEGFGGQAVVYDTYRIRLDG